MLSVHASDPVHDLGAAYGTAESRALVIDHQLKRAAISRPSAGDLAWLTRQVLAEFMQMVQSEGELLLSGDATVPEPREAISPPAGPTRRVSDIAVEFAQAYRAQHGHLPVILGVPIYRYLGERGVELYHISSPACDLADRDGTVLIMTGEMQVAEIQFSQLELDVRGL